MQILHVASEVAPLIKTGGLADVVGSLPAAQARLGHQVTVLVPGYPAVIERAGDLQRLTGFNFGAPGRAGLLRGKLPGDVELLIIDNPNYFSRPGDPYLDADGKEWPDNHRRFALLGRVGAELARTTHSVDIVHAHDWHAGLTLAYLDMLGGGPASCFTIHNLAFHGLYSPSQFLDTGLTEAQYHIDGVEYHGDWSFIKAGLNFSNAITTVSPTYAREILTPELGMGLDGLLNHRRAHLHGILNGVDYEVWSPANDALLPSHYDADSLRDKVENKTALRLETGLDQNSARPVFGVVSRLTRQKGFDFALDVISSLIQRNKLQLVLIGTGDAELETGFVELAARSPKHCSVRIEYDEAAAHRIFGGADAILVPSLFEPCGLTQLYGLRYGTLPVVRNTGGLADTINGYTGHNLDSADGFCFNLPTAIEFEQILNRVCEVYDDRPTWQQLMRNAMNRDFSWARSAKRYIDLYKSLLPR